MKEFTDTVFQQITQLNFKNHLYEQRILSTTEIFLVVQKYSSIFKSNKSFTSWCSSAGVNFIKGDKGRKVSNSNKGEASRARKLSVMKEQFRGDVASRIGGTLAAHQIKMKKLKEEGYTIVGYCRKSVQAGMSKNHVQLLQTMVQNLRERSLADYVFVSPMENAIIPLHARDKKCNMDILKQLKDIHGNCADLLSFITNREKICLVTLDYAGLTTNSRDLEEILRHHRNIEQIVVDLYYYENRFDTMNREDLLHDTQLLNTFAESREAFKQRHL